MTQPIRLIPCLDINQGRVVKGVNFVGLKDAGDPVEIAKRYSQEGADELALLDISATNEGRETTLELVKQVAEVINIPLIVGGGINSLEAIEKLLAAGASKVSLGSIAVKNPQFIAEAAAKFGSEKILVAIDAKQVSPAGQPPSWEIYSQGGKKATGVEAINFAKQLADLGAGELLVTSMDQDGTQAGFDLELTRSIAELTGLPVIASGGVGELQHLADGVLLGKASAVLAASIFHFGKFSLAEAKAFMQQQGINLNHA